MFAFVCFSLSLCLVRVCFVSEFGFTLWTVPLFSAFLVAAVVDFVALTPKRA